MAAASSYELLSVEKEGRASYMVTVSATTPYMADVVTKLAAAKQSFMFQMFTSFQASGAAAKVAEMNMEGIPLHTDVVSLAVIVKNDVPILYHPVSLARGDTLPQYAFLWGAMEFQGVRDADLLIANRLGGGMELSAKEVAAIPRLAEVTEYYASVFEKIQAADISALSELSIAGASLGEQHALRDTYREYRKEFANYEAFEADTVNRLKSYEYEMKSYLCTELEYGVESYAVIITYSVIDPLTNKRSYYTAYDIVDKKRSGISDSEAAVICLLADHILENSLGGDKATLIERLRLGGYELAGESA
jgi:hypothetical protein